MASPRNLDLGLLRTFLAVAETGRMTIAARVVNLSQGAVSQQIKRLEELFGEPLFERHVEAVRLTRAGERLMVGAHRLVAQNDEVLGSMRAADFTGEVRLGVPHDIVGHFLPPILRNFRQANPQVLATLVSDTSLVLRRALEAGEVDLALTTDLQRGTRAQWLLSDRLVWVGARGGDAFQRRPLSVSLGQENCGFRACAIDALGRSGIPWRPICQVGSLEPVFATLEADMAIAPFLSRTVPERLAIIADPRLPDLPPFNIHLRLPGHGADKVAAELARYIRDGFRSRFS
jgi:DNA-binding transcriptional LysR family regulator